MLQITWAARRILMDTTRPLCLLSVVFAAYSVQLLHTLYIYRFHTHAGDGD